MTDRELLELAAKAAGHKLEWDARGAYLRSALVSGSERTWNPLTDDGDALRLAVQLRLNIDFTVYDWLVVAKNEASTAYGESTIDGNDPYAAARRAIVRAAAEIGRQQ
jgi:hypothetical protein